MNDIDKAWKRFALEIVKQAVKDYRKSFAMYIKVGCDERFLPIHIMTRLEDCRKFFASGWCTTLCDIDGAKMQKAIENRCFKKAGFKNL